MKTLKAVIKAHKNIFTTLLITFAMLFSACDGNNNSGTGTMRVSLTDAPGDFAAVNIEIHQVLVKRAIETGDDDNLNETLGMGNEEIRNSGWEVIFNDTLIINLLDYQNGAMLPMGEVDLEPGRYQQIRLLLGNENTVTLLSGGTFPLNTPSGQTSGYKLNVMADIEEGQVYDLVIDFDASRSIVIRGNGQFNLKPVLRTVHMDRKGSISGVVSPTEANPYVFTIVDSDTLGTIPNEMGEFTIIGLNSGNYTIKVEAGNEMYADSSFTDITLEANEDFAIADTLFLRRLTNN